MTQFSIRKTSEYVWRAGPFGNSAMASHGYITCWHVVDDEGKVVAGGNSQGNNTRSGEPNIPRRKDALAWIAGFEAASAGSIEFVETPSGLLVRASALSIRKSVGLKMDANQADFYRWGCQHWANSSGASSPVSHATCKS